MTVGKDACPTPFPDLDVIVQPWSLSRRRSATLVASVAVQKPGMKIAAIAVLAPRNVDAFAPDMFGAVLTVERGCFEEFLNAAALKDYLQRRIPVIACFEAADDLKRCEAAFSPQVTPGLGCGETQ